jgi:hypothetical protein
MTHSNPQSFDRFLPAKISPTEKGFQNDPANNIRSEICALNKVSSIIIGVVFGTNPSFSRAITNYTVDNHASVNLKVLKVAHSLHDPP